MSGETRRAEAGAGAGGGRAGPRLFWFLAVWLVVVTVAGGPVGFFPLARLVTGEWLEYVTPESGPVGTFRALAESPVFRPWEPLEIYYAPLSLLDHLAGPWLVLFMVVVSLLPPSLARAAPVVWGLAVLLLLAGLRVDARLERRSAWRRAAHGAALTALAVWAVVVALAVGVAAVHDARVRREAAEAEAARLVEAATELRAALPALAAVLEEHRDRTGSYPARSGRLDWEALGYGPGTPGFFGPEVMEFTCDATPGVPRPEFLPRRTMLRWVVEAVRGGWPLTAGDDFVYLEYAKPDRVTVIVAPGSERARVLLGHAGLLLEGRDVSTPGLAELAPVLEQAAADHWALAIEELGFELRRLFLEYRTQTGTYPSLDREGTVHWSSLYDRTGVSPETMDIWVRRTWDLRFVAVISPFTAHPYLPYLYPGSVLYYGRTGEGVDVYHVVSFSADGFSFVFVPCDESLRSAMARRAGPDARGADLIVTPEGVIYGEAPGDG